MKRKIFIFTELIFICIFAWALFAGCGNTSFKNASDVACYNKYNLNVDK